MQLLQGNYNRISDLGVEIIAISHESVAENKKVHQQNKLKYFSLSDPTAKTIRDYNVLDFGKFSKVSFSLLINNVLSAGVPRIVEPISMVCRRLMRCLR